jgi:hypothetical protein
VAIEDSSPVAEPAPPRHEVPASRRSCLFWAGILLGVVLLLGLAGHLLLRAMFGGTTATVTNVGDRPVEGVVLLAVEEGGDVVRDEWPVGTLRPGETRQIEDVFAADTDLAVRLRGDGGTVSDDRLPIYLGSPATQRVRIDVTTSGVVRAWRRSGGEDRAIERDRIQRGLKPGP